jgi:hypothetical protein
MGELRIPYTPQPRQIKYHQAKDIDELLYGGAAGGGKSEATIWDSLKYAVQYKGSRQVIFRRTFPDLQRSIIMRTLQAYPKQLCKYNQSKHEWVFVNGSVIELAYWDNDSNYMNYQGAEYDVIRWEELTQFEERWYIYMLSRLRSGGNDYPKAVKSTTNPGGVGHAWVKKRFIDIGEPETVHSVPVTNDNGVQLKYPPQHPRAGELAFNRVIFFPANVFDNMALMNNDPSYLMRLMALPDNERKQLLEGDWDTFAGQYFSEFSREVHVVEPFEIPLHWKKFRALDEGYNDPFVCLWITLDPKGNAYIYRELVKRQLITTEQIRETKLMSLVTEEISYNVADTSFWNKAKTENVRPADLFAEHYMPLQQAKKERINGWKRMREWLHVYDEMDTATGKTYKSAKLKIFSTCRQTIEAIPSMIYDSVHIEDVESHGLDHAPDCVRYWCMSRPKPTATEAWNATPQGRSKFDTDEEETKEESFW